MIKKHGHGQHHKKKKQKSMIWEHFYQIKENIRGELVQRIVPKGCDSCLTYASSRDTKHLH